MCLTNIRRSEDGITIDCEVNGRYRVMEFKEGVPCYRLSGMTVHQQVIMIELLKDFAEENEDVKVITVDSENLPNTDIIKSSEDIREFTTEYSSSRYSDRVLMLHLAKIKNRIISENYTPTKDKPRTILVLEYNRGIDTELLNKLLSNCDKVGYHLLLI